MKIPNIFQLNYHIFPRLSAPPPWPWPNDQRKPLTNQQRVSVENSWSVGRCCLSLNSRLNNIRMLQPLITHIKSYVNFLHEVADSLFLCIHIDFALKFVCCRAHGGIWFQNFLSTRFFKLNSATNCLSCSFYLRSSLTSSLLASRIVSPFKRFFPASKSGLLHF